MHGFGIVLVCANEKMCLDLGLVYGGRKLHSLYYRTCISLFTQQMCWNLKLRLSNYAPF